MIVSVIIPIYNSSKILEKQIDYIKKIEEKISLSIEWIIVDDGSDDEEKLKKICLAHHLTYVGYSKNEGKGFAIQYGLNFSRGNLVFFTDADIPFQLDDLEDMVFEFQQYAIDLIVGDRTLKESTYFDHTFSKRTLGSKLFSYLVEKLILKEKFDSQCGLKGFRKDVLQDLFSTSKMKRFTFDVELLLRAKQRHYNIRKWPVTLRSHEESTVVFLRDGFRMFVDLLKIKYYQLLGRY